MNTPNNHPLVYSRRLDSGRCESYVDVHEHNTGLFYLVLRSNFGAFTLDGVHDSLKDAKARADRVVIF